jgi:glycerol-1-phosphatase
VLAPPQHRPTYVSETLEVLLDQYPEISQTGDGFRCGGWTAARTPAGQLTLDGDGSGIDGLRALCAAAWSAPDGVTREQAEAALARLGAAGLRI